jgi:hypothetical protein
MPAPADDPRPAAVVAKQYREFCWLRQQLVKQGQVAKDADAHEVVAALRRAIPPDLWGELPPTARR